MNEFEKLSLQVKLESRTTEGNKESFRVISPEEMKRVHNKKGNLREVNIPGMNASKVLPEIYITKITVDDTSESSAFLEDGSLNPHISIHPVDASSGKSEGDVFVSRPPATISSLRGIGPPPGISTTVRVSMSIKKTYDDDNIVATALQTLGMDKFLKLKLFAIVDNPSQEKQILEGLSTAGPGGLSALKTDASAGLHVAGGTRGISLASKEIEEQTINSRDFEITSGGTIIKNLTIEKSFIINGQPEDMVIYVQPYYDIFNNPEFEKEMGVQLGSLIEDERISGILTGKMKSERIFKNGDLLDEAYIFTANRPSMNFMGDPYTGEIIEVREGYYARPRSTSETNGHQHSYYVDDKGNGWTSHHDHNGVSHCHIIRSFRVSASGRYRDLEEEFVENINAHSHNLPISTANALYRKSVSLDYFEDNRSPSRLGNMRISTNKTIEDAFSFLRRARRRSNLIKPVNNTSELSIYTSRDSTKRYFTEPMYSCDTFGNCRFVFAFDHLEYTKANTLFGKYIADPEALMKYTKIHEIKVVRKMVTQAEYESLKNFRITDFENFGRFPERVICSSHASRIKTRANLDGVSDTSTLVEFTPAGSQRSSSRPARYFTVVDKSYTITGPSISDFNTGNTIRTNESPTLSGGTYVYGIEVTLVDNTVDYLVEAQRGLYKNIQMLTNYIAIGARRGNNSGSYGHFTKNFVTKSMDELSRAIVDESMLLLRRIFLDETSSGVQNSAAAFQARAKKMYLAIRPKGGSLIAAKRFLNELSSIVGYVRDITKSDEVGKYAKKKDKGSTSTGGKNFPSNSSHRLKKIKYYFKDCFHKSSYLKQSISFFPQRAENLQSLTRIPIEQFDESNLSGYSLYMTSRVQPKLVRTPSGDMMEMSEKTIKSMFYSDEDKPIIKSDYSAESQNLFEVVENQKYLSKEKNSLRGLTAISLFSLFGSSELEDQVAELQKEGYLPSKSKKNSADQKKMRSIVSGEELTATLQEFNKSNSYKVAYLSSITNKKNMFKPQWSMLNSSILKNLKSENRPILCRLYKHGRPNSYSVSAIMDEYFLIIPRTDTIDYSPTKKREDAVLQDVSTPYVAEVVTSNPQIRAATFNQSTTTTTTTGGGGGY